MNVHLTFEHCTALRNKIWTFISEIIEFFAVMDHFNSRKHKKEDFLFPKRFVRLSEIFAGKDSLGNCSLSAVSVKSNMSAFGSLVQALLFCCLLSRDSEIILRLTVVDSECNSDQVHVIFCARICKVMGFVGWESLVYHSLHFCWCSCWLTEWSHLIFISIIAIKL